LALARGVQWLQPGLPEFGADGLMARVLHWVAALRNRTSRTFLFSQATGSSLAPAPNSPNPRSANFVLTAFSEVRLIGILRSPFGGPWISPRNTPLRLALLRSASRSLAPRRSASLRSALRGLGGARVGYCEGARSNAKSGLGGAMRQMARKCRRVEVGSWLQAG
jgi:hypothetical protein